MTHFPGEAHKKAARSGMRRLSWGEELLGVALYSEDRANAKHTRRLGRFRDTSQRRSAFLPIHLLEIERHFMKLNSTQKLDLTGAAAAMGGIGLGLIASEVSPPLGGALLMIGVALVLGAGVGRVLAVRRSPDFHHDESLEHKQYTSASAGHKIC